MKARPKISVITASKNTGCFLRQTIESILQQSFTDYEHVVVDGVSTDKTLEILKEYKHIRWISEPDEGADDGFYKAMKMISNIVFTKNRPLQLEGYLESLSQTKYILI